MRESEPKINLKQHQRFKRVFPWGLLRKLVIVAVMGGLFYYLMNSFPSADDSQNIQIEFEIDDN